MTRRFFCALVLVLACSSEAAAQRCDLCGMTIDARSGWRAGARSASGDPLVFDAPKCMFRYRAQRGAIEGPWVIEYYAQARHGASDLFYVLGSDVEGPMGRDLVPIAGRENAERFMAEHHGTRVLAFREVTDEIVATLFR